MKAPGSALPPLSPLLQRRARSQSIQPDTLATASDSGVDEQLGTDPGYTWTEARLALYLELNREPIPWLFSASRLKPLFLLPPPPKFL